MGDIAGREWLRGRRVVVTAGGTREPLDPVRFLGNRSSGRMGWALARVAADADAIVTLITTVGAPVALRRQVILVDVATAAEMNDAVRTALVGADVLIMAAAVADYRPQTVSARKLKKSAEGLTLCLVPTVDILAGLRDDPLRRGCLVIGFAAETDELASNAQRKLIDKGADLIVLNDISAPGIGMGTRDNAVTIFGPDGVVAEVSRRPKRDVADAVLAVAGVVWRNRFALGTDLAPQPRPRNDENAAAL